MAEAITPPFLNWIAATDYLLVLLLLTPMLDQLRSPKALALVAAPSPCEAPFGEGFPTRSSKHLCPGCGGQWVSRGPCPLIRATANCARMAAENAGYG